MKDDTLSSKKITCENEERLVQVFLQCAKTIPEEEIETI